MVQIKSNYPISKNNDKPIIWSNSAGKNKTFRKFREVVKLGKMHLYRIVSKDSKLDLQRLKAKTELTEIIK